MAVADTAAVAEVHIAAVAEVDTDMAADTDMVAVAEADIDTAVAVALAVGTQGTVVVADLPFSQASTHTIC